MSTCRKLPRPTYLYQPDGIIDIHHKGYDFRITLHNLCGRFPRFEFFTHRFSEVRLHKVLTDKQQQAYDDAIAVWKGRYERDDNPDPEMPHAAIFKVLDAIVVFENKQREEQQAEWAAKHPKANSVLAHLRQKAAEKREAVQS